MSPARRIRLLVSLVCVAVGLLALGAGSASAAGGWWLLKENVAPSDPQPGQPVIINANAVNSGYETIKGTEASPIVVKETLPAGIEGPSVTAVADFKLQTPTIQREEVVLNCPVASGVVTCTFPQTGEKEGVVRPTESIHIEVQGKMSSTAAGTASTKLEVLSAGSATNEKGKAEAVTVPPPLVKELHVTSAATPFGVERYEIRPENENGGLETQAGAHPFQLTSIFDLNEDVITAKPYAKEREFPSSPALPKNLHFMLPAGLIGKAAGVPRCSGSDFASTGLGGFNECPEDTAIGYTAVAIFDAVGLGYKQGVVPVFNLQPEEGEPARFGFEFHDVPVVLTTRVGPETQYGVEVTVNEAPQSADVLSTQLTLWGVPKSAKHDHERGWQCLLEGLWVFGEKKCETSAELQTVENEAREKEHKPLLTEPEAFLSMPTTCQSGLVTSATGEAWSGQTFGMTGEESTEFTFSPFTGCEHLSFEPSIEVQPDKHQAATPSGYTVSVSENQSGTVSGKEAKPAENGKPAEPAALANPGIHETVLTLPAGVYASAGASQGLSGCSSQGFGFSESEPLAEAPLGELLQNNKFNDQQPVERNAKGEEECLASSKIGTVDIETPLLEEHLEGSVYLSREDTAPFTSPLVLYIFAETPASKKAVESGGEPKVQVKLAGEVELESDGQLKSTFRDTPPVQFGKLTLHLNDGPRASQATPEKCGPTNESSATFEASSGTHASATSNFAINEGAGGGACNPAFQPGFEAGAESGQAGGFSPFKVLIRRPDGMNQLRSISVTEPKGAAAMLAKVPECPTAVAEAIAPEQLPKRNAQSTLSCPASSQIGESTAVAGLGTGTYGAGAARVTLPGKVYLTGPYHGAPFGLLDVTETEGHTGIFHLGNIGVMSTITVNKTTAQATVTSNPLPQFVEGVPASISEILVNVNRPEFSFNPTNCTPLEATGTLTGWGSAGVAEGVASVSSPFHAANCSSLPFKPKIEVSVESNVSRVDGTGMVIKISSGAGQANIGKTKLEFPKTIPSRLPTLHESCLAAVFERNPAECKERSKIGMAIAHTPVLKSPLVGPVYLVSHGSAAFPDAEIVLQGEGVELVLDGQTEISESGANKGVTISSFENVPDAPVETFEVKLPRKEYSAFSGYGNLCEEKPTMPTKFTGQNGAVTEEDLKIDVTGCSGVLGITSHKESELQKLLKQCKKAKNKKVRAKCDATAHKRVAAIQTCQKKDKKSKSKRVKCEAAARKKYVLKTK